MGRCEPLSNRGVRLRVTRSKGPRREEENEPVQASESDRKREPTESQPLSPPEREWIQVGQDTGKLEQAGSQADKPAGQERPARKGRVEKGLVCGALPQTLGSLRDPWISGCRFLVSSPWTEKALICWIDHAHTCHLAVACYRNRRRQEAWRR